jgi:heterodisulfide reductase subunit B2
LSEPYLLYSGCLIPTRLPFLEHSSRFVLDRIGVDYEPFPDATCCVEPIGLRSLGYDTWLAVAGRLLSIAEKHRSRVLTLCNGCYLSLKEAEHALSDRKVREKVNQILEPTGHRYEGNAKVEHFVQLVHRTGEKRWSEMAIDTQSRFSFAVHPGCHMVRPSQITQIDNPYSTHVIEDLAKWSGAKVVHSDEWPRCCGGGLTGIDDRISSAILNDNIVKFRQAGANAILTPCPFCFVQFDLKQKDDVPVLYLAELLALALGASSDEIGLKYHRIKILIR